MIIVCIYIYMSIQDIALFQVNPNMYRHMIYIYVYIYIHRIETFGFFSKSQLFETFLDPVVLFPGKSPNQGRFW